MLNCGQWLNEFHHLEADQPSGDCPTNEMIYNEEMYWPGTIPHYFANLQQVGARSPFTLVGMKRMAPSASGHWTADA